jgi:hypothetical protein
MATPGRSTTVALLPRLWASLTSLSRVGPGPRTLAAKTAIGLTMMLLAEPLTIREARRVAIAKKNATVSPSTAEDISRALERQK